MSTTTHKTKGIVLRSIKYGDTSIIATIYTELFGLQTYLVKGVRKTSKKGANHANLFLPAAILDLQVYHNELKQIQFIKDYQWDYLYKNIYYNVLKNASAMFAIELLQHSIKQPEANSIIFYFIEDCLKNLDDSDETCTANFPLYFILQLGNLLGFAISGNYNSKNIFLDLREGYFIDHQPIHKYFIESKNAEITSLILSIKKFEELSVIKLNKNIRRQLLDNYIHYFSLHITNFIELKSIEVLKEVLE